MQYYGYEIPEELEPMSGLKYFLYFILYTIPIIGQIFLICHAIGSHNLNKRGFARGFLFAALLGVIVFGGSAVMV